MVGGVVDILLTFSLAHLPEATKPGEKKKKGRDSTKFADDGKLIVSDEEQEGGNKNRRKAAGQEQVGGGNMEVTLDDIIEEVGSSRLGKKRKLRESEDASDEEEGDEEEHRGGHRAVLKAKSKGKQQQAPRRLGEEYASKVCYSFHSFSLFFSSSFIVSTPTQPSENENKQNRKREVT